MTGTVAAGKDVAAVVRKRHEVDGVGVAFKRFDSVASCQVVDTHGLIHAARGDVASVRSEGDAVDEVVMAREALYLLGGRHVPQVDIVVVAADQDLAAVAVDGHAVDVERMVVALDLVAVLDVPAAGGAPPPFRGEASLGWG